MMQQTEWDYLTWFFVSQVIGIIKMAFLCANNMREKFSFDRIILCCVFFHNFEPGTLKPYITLAIFQWPCAAVCTRTVQELHKDCTSMGLGLLTPTGMSSSGTLIR